MLRQDAFKKGYDAGHDGHDCDPPYQTLSLRKAYRNGYASGANDRDERKEGVGRIKFNVSQARAVVKDILKATS